MNLCVCACVKQNRLCWGKYPLNNWLRWWNEMGKQGILWKGVWEGKDIYHDGWKSRNCEGRKTDAKHLGWNISSDCFIKKHLWGIWQVALSRLLLGKYITSEIKAGAIRYMYTTKVANIFGTYIWVFMMFFGFFLQELKNYGADLSSRLRKFLGTNSMKRLT